MRLDLVVSIRVVFHYGGMGLDLPELVSSFRSMAVECGVTVNCLDDMENLNANPPYIAFQTVVTGKCGDLLSLLCRFRSEKCCAIDMIMGAGSWKQDDLPK